MPKQQNHKNIIRHSQASVKLSPSPNEGHSPNKGQGPHVSILNRHHC